MVMLRKPLLRSTGAGRDLLQVCGWVPVPFLFSPCFCYSTDTVTTGTFFEAIESMAEKRGDMPVVDDSHLNEKRQDHISWDDYFMAVAFLSAQRSKDPSTQVGACIVNDEKKIVGIGYNGMPNGCDDDLLPWRRTADDILETKYPYVCHAEMNAILNKNAASVKGCTIYVALFPCNECSKLIIQSGISKVIYMSDKHHDKPGMIASRKLLDMAKVEYVKHQPKKTKFVIDFESMRQYQPISDGNTL